MKTLDDFLFELLGQWGLLEKKYEDLQGEGVVLDFSNTRGQQFRLRTITTDKIADFAFTREKLPYFRSFHFDAAGSPVFGVDRLVPGISLTNDFYADDNNGEYYFYTSGEFVRTYKIQYFFDELPTNGRAGYVYVDRRIDDVNPDFYYFTSDSDYSFVDLNEINYVHEEIDLPEIGEEDHFYISSELSLFPQKKEEVLFASDGIILPEDTTSVKYSDKYYLFIDGVRTEVFPEKSIRGEDFISKAKEKNYREVVYQQTIGESEEAYFSADLRDTDENAYFEEQQLIRVDDLSELMGQQIGSKVFVSEENFYIDLKQEERIQIKDDDSFLTQGAPADINDIFV
ncbi:MAG: hypothetical protein PHW93_03450, partial [Candidatus Methanomethylophilaceae archaeon]|nr:hypothetical protein [Candidatus Methanomethylophilaceae archaeon]